MAGVPNMNTSSTQQLNEYDLWDISEFLNGQNWIKLGRQLRVAHAVLHKIDKNSNNDYRACAYEMLLAWYEAKPDITLQDLLTALKKLEWELPVRQIKHYFEKRSLQNRPADYSMHKSLRTTIYEQNEMFVGGGTTSDIIKYRGLDKDREVSVKKMPQACSDIHHQPKIIYDEQAKPILNTQFDEPISWTISKYLQSPKWIYIGQQLEIPYSKLDEIQQAYKHNHRECAFRMLLAWHQSKTNCIVQDLLVALEELEWTTIIQEIIQCLIHVRTLESDRASTQITDSTQLHFEINSAYGTVDVDAGVMEIPQNEFRDESVMEIPKGGPQSVDRNIETPVHIDLQPSIRHDIQVEPEKQVLPSTYESQAEIKLNNQLTWTISKCLEDSKWIHVGRQLDVSFPTLNEIEEKNKHNHRECAFQMLNAWHEHKPECVVKDLLDALKELKWTSPIQEIKELCNSPKTNNPRKCSKITLSNRINGHEGHGINIYKGSYKGREAAIKKVPIEFTHVAENEIKILMKVDGYPNVIRYFGQEKDENKFYIILELCQCNLSDFYTDDFKGIRNAKSTKSWLRDITQGLSYLHAASIIHCDFKPQNILISQPNYLGHIIAKISGFADSKISEEIQDSRSRKRKTGGWTALEVIKNPVQETTAADVFSLGCIYYYMITNGKQIFYSDYDVECRPDMSYLKSDDATIKILIAKMINLYPECRPCCKDIMNDMYFVWMQS